jgi:hypothetical protein
MSDPTLSLRQRATRVSKQWPCYDYLAVRDTLRKVQREFGKPGVSQRWHFRGVDLYPGYRLDFYFADPHDAIIFGLKYLE